MRGNNVLKGNPVILIFCSSSLGLSHSGKLGGFTHENNTIDSGELDIGRRAIQEVPPGVFWRSQLFIDQPQFLKFNISLQKDALIGVYGRKGLPPSHTQVRAGAGIVGCGLTTFLHAGESGCWHHRMRAYHLPTHR